ncbi:MAG: hypothetical protein O2954_02705 [bacterium]|nr:hypothetical protein [bacterium]
MSLIAGQALTLEIPLTVEETTGTERIGNTVNSGVPFPEGAVQDVTALRLLNAQGDPVLASIEPRARWLGDKSLKWVTVHFLADLPANGKKTYTLVTSSTPIPTSELDIQQTDKTITVTTGPAKFIIPTDRFALFDQVYLRTDKTREFSNGDALLLKPANVILVARNGESRVVPRTDEHKDEFRTELARIDEKPFTQTATVQTVEIEERGPGRAVVALKGTFSTPAVKSLDFTARLYFYSGSPAAEITFSVQNRQMDHMAHFVGIDRLAVEVQLKTTDPPTASLGIDGKTIEKPLGNSDVQLTQTQWNTCTLNNAAVGEKYDGWIRLTSESGTLTAGTRWSWQVYPIGAEARSNGTVALNLKPIEGERVDLYTAGAKTHFLFLHFAHDKAPAPQAIATGTSNPLFAVCDPNWYCQETRVFGDLYANNPALFQEQYRSVIARYQNRIDECLKRIVDQRPQPEWEVNEFGWLNFGSGLHYHACVRENAHESWWDGNYYDFPHAVIVNYLRTGDLLNLTTAVEAGLHLADLDICHSFPGHPDRAGSPRSGPVVGHFRDYTRGQEFAAHSSFTFYKNESLYELYYLTGERWFHEAGLMSSEFAMAYWGRGALRNIAHGIWGVLSAYQDTHAKKYLDRAQFFVDEWAKPWQDEHNGSFDDQLWMYGLQFEAYDKYFRVTGDTATAEYCLKAIDAVIAEEDGDGKWKQGGARNGICLVGYGYAYDYTGEAQYLNYGLQVLEKTTSAEGVRVKTFAQQFRASPYFLKVLTIGYKPEAVLIEGGDK